MEKTIGIIGAGASGTLVAAQLLRSGTALEVILWEADGAVGRGLAYRTENPSLRLNVPVKKMSALPSDPDHFLAWLKARDASVKPDDFVPRRLYGMYLADVLESARAGGTEGRLTIIQERAVEATSGQSKRFIVRSDSGQTRECDALVLALGVLPPGEDRSVLRGIAKHPNFVTNVWTDPRFHQLPECGTILILGTGLTMVDVALSLSRPGRRLLALSRRGFVPAAHRPGLAPKPWLTAADLPLSPAVILHRFRREIARLDDGESWRCFVDGLRPLTQALWQSWTERQKRSFLRHLRPYWDVHRHRMAPEVAAQLQLLRDEGRLDILAGRVLEATEKDGHFEVHYQQRQTRKREVLRVDAVVSCMGHDTDFRSMTDPLLVSLFRSKLAEPDALSLGLASDAEGEISANLFTLGPLRKGTLWESTAMPEITVQAERLALHLAERIT